MDDKQLIKTALKALGITDPYFRVEVEQTENKAKVTFYLYFGRVEVWSWDKRRVKWTNGPVEAIPQPVPCEDFDFTVIPGVGKVTAQKLNDNGVYTFAMLRQAWDVWLRKNMSRLVSNKTLEAITNYLEEEKT